MNLVNQAILFFSPHQTIQKVTLIHGGNVNDSWKVLLSSEKLFILQKLSPTVFPDPRLVMANLERVTGHLYQELQGENDALLQIPKILHSPTGLASYEDPKGNHWRMLSFIDNSRTLTALDSPEQAMEIGRVLACFHQLLSTLDPADLYDPLPGFHVTPEYLNQYDSVHRQHIRPTEQEKQCAALIEQSRHRADILERHRNALSSGIIHGDPKVANFLFAKDSHSAISLIDLDTVMPGLLLHDLGDSLRSCCNRRGEEVKSPGDISFDAEIFEAFLRGYGNQGLRLLNTKDRELLIDAAWLISFELGLRFFTDHLAGNRYFKVQRPGQNLYRALIQLQLAQSICEQRSRLDLLWQQIMMTDKS